MYRPLAVPAVASQPAWTGSGRTVKKRTSRPGASSISPQALLTGQQTQIVTDTLGQLRILPGTRFRERQPQVAHAILQIPDAGERYAHRVKIRNSRSFIFRRESFQQVRDTFFVIALFH